MTRTSPSTWPIILITAMAAAGCLAEQKRPPNPSAELLSRLETDTLLRKIRSQSPTTADALQQLADLRTELGETAFHDALAQLAAFVETDDPHCRTALQILTDQYDHPKSTVGSISIDGRSNDWAGFIPPPQTRRWDSETKDRARHVWEQGIAAVVRGGRLIAMLGITDLDIINQPDNNIRFKIDCADSPQWDLYLHVWQKDNAWHGRAEYHKSGYRAGQPECEVTVTRAAAKDILELSIDIRDCASPRTCKPIWTLYATIQTKQDDKTYHPRTKSLPIINEDAALGQAAPIGIRMLMLLAADVGLVPNDRTAAAIAITSTTIYATSNEQVRTQLRKDAADQLRFARELTAYQHETQSQYRLDQYPIEAQIAWANRCIWLCSTYLGWNHNRDKPADMENYRWSYTPIETLRQLNALIRQEDLLSTDANETASNINRWVASHLERRLYWYQIIEGRNKYKDDPEKRKKYDDQYEKYKTLREAGLTIVGDFKGRTIYQCGVRNTEIYLRLIRETGRFYGKCPDEAWVAQDSMRSIGIAPMAYNVAPEPDHIGHCWAAHFNPTTNAWHSAQAGRSDGRSWLFNIDRIAVHHYAASCARACGDSTTTPYPLYYRKRLIGRQIAERSKTGIPTSEIRTWMLNPWFAP